MQLRETLDSGPLDQDARGMCLIHVSRLIDRK